MSSFLTFSFSTPLVVPRIVAGVSFSNLHPKSFQFSFYFSISLSLVAKDSFLFLSQSLSFSVQLGSFLSLKTKLLERGFDENAVKVSASGDKLCNEGKTREG